MVDAKTFPPYKDYAASERSINNFIKFTSISYQLSAHLLEANSDELDHLIPTPTLEKFREKASFTMGDLEFGDPVLKQGWVTYSEYARLAGMSESEVESLALDGKLGQRETHPKTNKTMIFWPPEYHAKNKELLPDIGGNKTYDVPVTFRGEMSIEGDDSTPAQEKQALLMAAAQRIGEADRVKEAADNYLYQSGFLLQWTVFEVFLRKTVHEMFRRHPGKILSDNSTKISYSELWDLSAGFSAAGSLVDAIAQREIEAAQESNRSVHGLINYLKSNFKFEEDPYAAWFVHRGTRQDVSYQTLMDLKNLRNQIVHELEAADEEAAGDFSEEDYGKARLTLVSIAFSIANSIASGKYHQL